MLLSLKDFKKSDNFTVSDLLQDEYFLKDLLLSVLVNDITLLDCLYGDIFPSELVDRQSGDPKSSLSNNFDIGVILKSG